MKAVLAIAILLLCAGLATAQSTTVSGSVTDAGAQTWNNGTFTFNFVPNPSVPTPPIWSGGALHFSITGTMDGSGNYSVSIPSNTAINPVGTKWLATFCPQATSPCFTAQPISVTGATQTFNVTPPAIAISLINPTAAIMRAYSTSEISAVVLGSWFYLLSSNVTQQCTSVSGTTCLTWANVGGGAAVPPPANALLKSNGAGAMLTTNETDDGTNFTSNINARFKGANPYADITAYGARTCNVSTTPCATGLTASINNGTNSAIISAASTFINGDGVVIYGAGPTQSLTTPTGLAVTNVLSQMGINTGLTTASAAGSTTRCYKIIARTVGGGYTPASSEVCTSTGQATLGTVVVNLTSCSRSNTTVTCTTSSTHPALVGGSSAEVYIGGSPSDSSFRGWRAVSSAADSTHFTFIDTAVNTGNGASTSSTGGTASFFVADHLSWTTVTNAWLYYIYEGNSGAETLVATSRPQGILGGSGVTDLTFDWFGPTTMGNPIFPPWIPTTPPVSGANDNLSTTITGGAGTTTLTLATNAGATVAGATIRLDAKPAIVAAAAASSGASLYIPYDPSGNPFQISSFCDLTPYKSPIVQSGSLALRETIAVRSQANRWMGDRMTGAGGTVGGGGSTWAGYPQIIVYEAMPGVYFNSGFGYSMEGINYQNSGGNGVIEMLAEGGFNADFKDDNFTTGTSSNDLAGIGLYLRGTNAQSAAGIVMDKMTFGNGLTTDGASHNTPFFCNNCGDLVIRKGYVIHGGLIFNVNPVSATVKITGVHYNGGFTPLLTVGPGTTYISLSDPNLGDAIIMDTVGHPCVASFGSAQVFNGGCVPSGGSFTSPSITGTVVLATSGPGNYQNIFDNSLMGSFLQTGGESQSGRTELVQNFIGPGGLAVGYNNDSIWIGGQPPAAPTCTPAAGGSANLGGWFAYVSPVWWNGLDGAISPNSAACTSSSGNQTLNVTWTVPAGNPKGMRVWFGNGGSPATCANCGSIFPVTTTSMSWNTAGIGSPVYGGPPLGGPTMLMNGTTGMTAPIVLADSYQTKSNCNVNSVSPAACGSAAAGVVVVPTTTTTYTVNTTVVTANSRIFVVPRTDNTSVSGAPTCTAPPTGFIALVSGRTAGTSFTFSLPSTTGTSCWDYWIIN